MTESVNPHKSSNFAIAFWLLPANRRRGLAQFYRYCREVDDAVDEAHNEAEARHGVAVWWAELARVFEGGSPESATGKALQQVVREFDLQRADVEDVLRGVEMDIAQRRYPTFDSLHVYCYRVASAVGMSAVRIFGRDDAQARVYAEALGLALQLTNIIRDVAEDARRDRIYLPLDDLRRFEVSEADVLGGVRSERMRALLMFQAGRAHYYFEVARTALPRRERKKLLAAEAMRVVYFELLREIEARGFDVFSGKLSVSTGRKAWLAAQRLVARALPL